MKITQKSKQKKIRYDGARPVPILIYIAAVCTAMMYVFCRQHVVVCSIIMTALTAAIYMLFYKVRFRPIVTMISVFSLMIAALLIANQAIGMAADSSFMDFMFTATAEFSVPFAAATIALFSLVIGFIGCYFSAIMPRPCFLMLLTFLPLILSARTGRGINAVFTAVLFGTFVLASANLAAPVQAEGTAVFEDRSARRDRLIFSSIVAAAATLLAILIPKSTVTPQGDFLNEVTPGGFGYRAVGLTNFVSNSSVNTGNNTITDKLLFTARTSAPTYINRWSFDIYNGESGWSLHENYNTGYADWKSSAKNSSTARFINKVKKAAEEGAFDEYYPEYAEILAEIPYCDHGEYSVTIAVRDDSSTKVVLHPLNTISTSIEDITYRTERDEIFTKTNMPENAQYTLTYFIQEPSPEFSERFTLDEFKKLVNAAGSVDVITEQERLALLDAANFARSYRSLTSDQSITPKIRALAAEITAGLTSDHEKAAAIEKWFGSAGFVYDINFVPAKTDAEYFLFESKRGICSDFATAVTLLARAASLPAYYAEGFTLSEDNLQSDGLYYVTDKHAHAYTRAYIVGGGWVELDATRYAATAESGVNIPIGVYIAIAAAAVLTALAIVFRERLGWLCLRIRFPTLSRSDQIRVVYKRMLKLACTLSGSDPHTTTSGEAAEIVAQKLGMTQQAQDIRSAYDSLAFGGEAPQADAKQLLGCIKALLDKKRSIGKK